MCKDKNQHITGNNFYTNLNIIQLNCEAEELFEAMDLYNRERIVLPILRAYLHEHTHFIQHNTTPVGYYIKLLKDYQATWLPKITDEMLKSPDFTYPMMWHIQRRRKEDDRFKKPIHYYYWYLAEMVRLYLVGKEKTFNYYVDNMMKGEFYGIIDFVLELEPELIQLLDQSYDYNGRKFFDNQEQLKKIQLAATLTSFNMGGVLKSIFESQALLSEYFFDAVADERLEKALNEHNISPRHRNYLFPLILYKNTYSFDLSNKNDFLSFKPGFNAICQIALHAPILPFQDKLGQISIGDIEIDIRFIQMLLLQSKIVPPKSLNDYNRYIDELTEINGYKSLKCISQNIVCSENLIMNNRWMMSCSLKKEMLFLSAQKEYLDNPTNFLQLLSGQATPPSFFHFKFRNKKLFLDEDGFADLLHDLIYQYYKELLMGYNINKFANVITVSPVVEISDDSIEILNIGIELFNASIPKKLPRMVLENK